MGATYKGEQREQRGKGTKGTKRKDGAEKTEGRCVCERNRRVRLRRTRCHVRVQPSAAHVTLRYA